jgi:DNA-directed RNA polymerase specialized sigma24 family protein
VRNFPSHLWHLLVKTTARKAQELVKERENQKRHPGVEKEAPGLGERRIVVEIADPKPRPDLEVLANETIERLLDCLDGKGKWLRHIATWKWQGYSNEGIARMLGCSTRKIRRQLWLIRTIWAEEEPG